MKLYLVQHGKPVPKEENPDRPLSDGGKRDVEKVTQFLRHSGISLGKIFHSGKTRAKETAEILGRGLDPALKPQEREGLSPLDHVTAIADVIQTGEEDVLIAGHLPHLAKLAALLVTGDEATPVARFQQGGVVCLEQDKEGQWAVAWMVVPDILP
jgi:phosphohistidine phosphatase